jgi:hypothetical protein
MLTKTKMAILALVIATVYQRSTRHLIYNVGGFEPPLSRMRCGTSEPLKKRLKIEALFFIW